ncbi:MAG: Smr/MutS family protein [Bacteroidales bacterium]|nr:Smr/MutS family protein [Bacteroidales bacterium]MDD2425740.1 Smr/MutS family protein [Bacteroidales bacterium]MDD3989616.1 Smr/MutS family protein [Bacteroidales bacterium]MDD4638927.1 Smr/MutS family protein [Bacteroidales bacterium]
MRERVEQKLGFDRIRLMTAAGCTTAIALSMTQEDLFSFNPERVELQLSQTDEMRQVLMFENSFPDSGFADIYPFLKKLEAPASYLDLVSISRLRESQERIRLILHFFKNGKEGLYPRLKQMVEPVVLFPEITRRIDAIMDKYGQIKDNASDELFAIRKVIRDKESQISKRISSILKKAQSEGITDEDSSLSIRDGRMLIPVPVSNKKKIPGLIFDESASGKTAYIEPIEIVELNNLVRELRFAEQREILKILVDFADFLRPYLPDLLQSARVLGELDFTSAKARVAVSMQAGKPVISKEREFILIKGRHPLLQAALAKEGKEIVPLSFSLNRDKHILLISGPNAGGKSVCLKTAGLLQYMLQCGFLIPASESSELCLFREIYIDIGDEQSIENDLSTYSSHLKNMNDILTNADGESLVLIDEFGAGTEPAAGGAIAEAILTKLEEKGVFGIITTHYSNLKYYAGTSKGVINGGMQFDVQNIKPLFKLETGVPGSSFAFELARKMGLPESVVKLAEEKAGSDFVDLERNLKKIARNRRIWEEKVARIKTTDKTLENITDKYQKELAEIQVLKKSMLSQAREEASSIVSEANKKIEAVIREIRESQAEKERTKELRKELNQFTKEATEEKESESDHKITQKMEQLIRRREAREKRKAARERGAAQVKPGGIHAGDAALNKERALNKEVPLKQGDKVRLKGGTLLGEILRIDGKEISVATGSVITRMGIEKVERISENEYRSAFKKSSTGTGFVSETFSQAKLSFKPAIDIRGQRLDEALESVTRFIDDALMVGVSPVRILHGKGNGVLREEIRKYLKTIGGVASLRDEHIEQGGAGITVVELM